MPQKYLIASIVWWISLLFFYVASGSATQLLWLLFAMVGLHLAHYVVLLAYSVRFVKLSFLPILLQHLGLFALVAGKMLIDLYDYLPMYVGVGALEIIFGAYLLTFVLRAGKIALYNLSPEEKAQRREALAQALEALHTNSYATYFKHMATCTPQEELYVLKKLEADFTYNTNLSNFNNQCRIFAERLLRNL
jgi:hypothetical protein